MPSNGPNAVSLAQKLKQAIRNGRFVAGQRLVEADLCRLYGASRSHVREAIRRLEAEGVVVVQPNRGASVRTLSRADVERLYEIREMMEGLAARLTARAAASEAVRSGILEIKSRLADAEASGNIATYMRENEAFHNFLLEHSGNSFIDSILEQVMLPVFRLQFYMVLDRTIIEESNRQHDAIIAAILERDEDRAEAEMRGHVQASLALIRRIQDEVFDAQVRGAPASRA